MRRCELNISSGWQKSKFGDKNAKWVTKKLNGWQKSQMGDKKAKWVTKKSQGRKKKLKKKKWSVEAWASSLTLKKCKQFSVKNNLTS